MKKIKHYITKYGLFKSICLLFKKILSYIILFIRKVSNVFFELTHDNYFIIRSGIARPLYKNNWGDYTSIILLKQIAPDFKFIPYTECWNIKKKNNYLSVGSIITWMSTPSSIIWGSGVVYPEKKISAKPHKVYAVRGPLTRQYLLNNEIDCPEIYGDPALLFPRYYTPQKTKKYKFGLIPHFRDKNNHYIRSFLSRPDVLLIDVQDVNNWHLFIDKINMCEYILSSSLHGIILADAYGIPNLWIEFKDGEQKRFAFHDYFLSVSKNIETPVLIGENTLPEDLLFLMKNWIAPQINLEKLLSVCPFKNNKQ